MSVNLVFQLHRAVSARGADEPRGTPAGGGKPGARVLVATLQPTDAEQHVDPERGRGEITAVHLPRAGKSDCGEPEKA